MAPTREYRKDRCPYISGLLGLAMSLPFSPAFINTGPNHLIMLKVTAYAIPLKAADATKGAPSSWKALASMAMQIPVRIKRRQISPLEREPDCVECITSLYAPPYHMDPVGLVFHQYIGYPRTSVKGQIYQGKGQYNAVLPNRPDRRIRR